MHAFALVAGTISFRKPDILRIADLVVLSVFRIILADIKQQIAIGRDGKA